MKLFIKNSVIFIFILITYFLINCTINFFNIQNQLLPLTKTSILIVGDSHTQKSLDPNLFDNASNISQYAEPYLLTFWKLKKIFETFTPDTIIIGFSPHNISEFNDLKFSNSKWANKMFERSYTIINFNEISNEITVNKKLLYKKIWKRTALYPKKNHIDYIGKYSNINDSNLSDLKSVIDRHYFINNKQTNTSATSINYLNSIIKLCDSKKITIILLASPVHKDYFAKIPKEILEKYNSLFYNYGNKYLTINFLSNDYTDSLFLDYNHLNKFGSEKFTLKIKDKLNNRTY